MIKQFERGLSNAGLFRIINYNSIIYFMILRYVDKKHPLSERRCLWKMQQLPLNPLRQVVDKCEGNGNSGYMPVFMANAGNLAIMAETE